MYHVVGMDNDPLRQPLRQGFPLFSQILVRLIPRQDHSPLTVNNPLTVKAILLKPVNTLFTVKAILLSPLIHCSLLIKQPRSRRPRHSKKTYTLTTGNRTNFYLGA